MIRNILVAISLLTLLALGACEVDREPIPENRIVSEEGLIIDLEWTTGGSSAQAWEEADLDLFITTGIDEVDISTSAEFEQVYIENFYRDGSYIVTVEYFDGIAPVDFSLFFRGPSGSKNVVVESSFSVNEVGSVIDIVEIVKSGTTYSINPL